MKKKMIGQMLAGMDEKYIQEAMEAEKAGASGKRPAMKMRKLAAAAAVGMIVLGTGVSVGAATSDVFRDWIRVNFLGHEITKVDLSPEIKVEEKADLPLDGDAHMSLAENMEIYGEKESFVCQYHRKGDDEIIDQVYSVQGNGLKKLEMKRFHGKYDGVDFSFQYAIINQEIFGFNTNGDINEVFHYVDGDHVYVNLESVKEETCEKSCIARLDLKSGEVTKLTGDKTIGNMIMSPGGKVILINYRADGYWTAFDIASGQEKKMDEIDGYAHTDEVIFKGDYQVLTWGDTYKKNGTELTGTKVVDLRTGKRTASYKECGDYEPEWIYEQKKGEIRIRNVDGSVDFSIATDKDYKGYPHPLTYRGDYVLLGNLEEQGMPYYLCNLRKKTYRKIDAITGFKEEVEMYLAAKEGKMLLTDGKEAYLVGMD
jgi:hypothetical protein